MNKSKIGQISQISQKPTTISENRRKFAKNRLPLAIGNNFTYLTLQCVNGCSRLANIMPETTQKPILGPGSRSFCSAGIERNRKRLQGEHLVRCRHSTHSQLVRGFPGGCRWGSAALCDPNPPRPFARFSFTIVRRCFRGLLSRGCKSSARKASFCCMKNGSGELHE